MPTTNVVLCLPFNIGGNIPESQDWWLHETEDALQLYTFLDWSALHDLHLKLEDIYWPCAWARLKCRQLPFLTVQVKGFRLGKRWGKITSLFTHWGKINFWNTILLAWLAPTRSISNYNPKINTCSHLEKALILTILFYASGVSNNRANQTQG